MSNEVKFEEAVAGVLAKGVMKQIGQICRSYHAFRARLHIIAAATVSLIIEKQDASALQALLEGMGPTSQTAQRLAQWITEASVGDNGKPRIVVTYSVKNGVQIRFKDADVVHVPLSAYEIPYWLATKVDEFKLPQINLNGVALNIAKAAYAAKYGVGKMPNLQGIVSELESAIIKAEAGTAFQEWTALFEKNMEKGAVESVPAESELLRLLK